MFAVEGMGVIRLGTAHQTIRPDREFASSLARGIPFACNTPEPMLDCFDSGIGKIAKLRNPRREAEYPFARDQR
jgi:hypothetical protein